MYEREKKKLGKKQEYNSRGILKNNYSLECTEIAMDSNEVQK